ncbi:hypothetical protein [Nocardiopsis dassonvillei]|uniref:hypothetical protein n=1 Tax=Nocardiopsis dassonvillei TaxID=2014 RepID=UPI00366C653D
MLGKATSAIAVSALTAAGLLAWSAPATAETAPEVAAVPSCVRTTLNDKGWTDYLTVHNNCNSSVRVKVVIANRSDFACRTISAGGSHNYWWNYPGRFDGLVDC